MFRIAVGAALAGALLCLAVASAAALDRVVDPFPEPPCDGGTAPPCRELPALPCSRIAVPETPCRPVKPCWIEPWMCDRHSGPDWRTR